MISNWLCHRNYWILFVILIKKRLHLVNGLGGAIFSLFHFHTSKDGLRVVLVSVQQTNKIKSSIQCGFCGFRSIKRTHTQRIIKSSFLHLIKLFLFHFMTILISFLGVSLISSFDFFILHHFIVDLFVQQKRATMNCSLRVLFDLNNCHHSIHFFCVLNPKYMY